MKQLVQLQQHAADFKDLNAELIFVFREESQGIEGLNKILDKHQTKYILSLDPDKTSNMYSDGKGAFDNYVIDSDGIVRGKIDGTKTDRATAAELLQVLRKIENANSKP